MTDARKHRRIGPYVVILDPHTESDHQRQNLTVSIQGHPLAHADQVWLTSINAFVTQPSIKIAWGMWFVPELSCEQTDTHTQRHTHGWSQYLIRFYVGLHRHAVTQVNIYRLYCVFIDQVMQAYNRREWTFLSGSLPSLYDSKVITIVYLHLANKISEDDPHTITQLEETKCQEWNICCKLHLSYWKIK